MDKRLELAEKIFDIADEVDEKLEGSIYADELREVADKIAKL